MSQATTIEPPVASPQAEQAPVDVRPAEPPEATDTGPKTANGQIDLLLDTAVAVMVRLGQVEAPVRELLRLGPGSVLKLDKQVGEPVDLFVRDTRFATGELVVVGEQLGIRIREILPAGQK